MSFRGHCSSRREWRRRPPRPSAQSNQAIVASIACPRSTVWVGDTDPMKRIRIGSDRVVLGGRLQPAVIEIEGGRISGVGPPGSPCDIDATGLIVAAGFLDLQLNGGFGVDLVSQPERMWALGSELPRHGVTAFLPTIISSSSAARQRAREALRQRPVGYAGAEPLGVHFEGPMISPDQRGAHSARFLVEPSNDLITEWAPDTGVRLVTLAPELPGAIPVVRELVSRGITVAAGHTHASVAQFQAARDAGLRMVTHLFNAMGRLHHRDPGVPGASLADRSLVVGLIADGIHVDPTVIAAAWNAKGPEGVALVTDAVALMGSERAQGRLGDLDVVAGIDGVRSAGGRLAGSTLTMNRAVRNLRAFTGCSVEQAVVSASSTPAEVIKERARGTLVPGNIADLVVLGADLDVAMTICAGHVAYLDPTAPIANSTAVK